MVIPKLMILMILMILMVFISIVVMGEDSDVKRYDRRMSELSNAPLHMNMKQDTNGIEYV
tara:strand:- start:196 stop:375 length:180 start_codon:yes stop_codon:yes gene_type:complete